ncbi:MAG: hypothetical protein MN733_20975 [Nitrososphaera sp.]|nr:hypothetical protein [Nitrososphaera sp.]
MPTYFLPPVRPMPQTTALAILIEAAMAITEESVSQYKWMTRAKTGWNAGDKNRWWSCIDWKELSEELMASKPELRSKLQKALEIDDLTPSDLGRAINRNVTRETLKNTEQVLIEILEDERKPAGPKD